MKSGTFKIELGRGAKVDARTLVDTRMLVAGSSGSGKSYTMRVLAEQVAPKIQTIILDPEGEYTTLREKLDMVVVGEDGELAPTVPTAAKLARRLLELQVSTVIDLYALKLAERRAFVRHFLDSMMSAPKSLWRPCFVMLDEAHRFCPERGSGQSEATDSVITLLSQGRKRGYCGVLATQRLQKLNKDAAAETLNNLIGRTSLDTDVKRARDILGLAKGDESKLRGLKPGNWFGFGPAFVDTAGVCKFTGARAQTTHPQAGKRHRIQAPGPSARIRKVIGELSEIPAQVKEEAETEAALRKQVRELRRQLKVAAAPAKKEVRRLVHDLAAARRGAADPSKVDAAVNRALARQAKVYDAALRKVVADVGAAGKYVGKASNALLAAKARLADAVPVSPPPSAPSPPASPVRESASPQGTERLRTSIKLGAGMLRIVVALVNAGPSTRSDAAIIAGFSPKSGTYGTYLGRLRQQGLITHEGDIFNATPDAVEAVSGSYIPCAGEALQQSWAPKVGTGGVRRIFDALVESGADGLTRSELAEASQLEASSGTYGTYLARLKRKGLVLVEGKQVRLAPIFFR